MSVYFSVKSTGFWLLGGMYSGTSYLERDGGGVTYSSSFIQSMFTSH